MEITLDLTKLTLGDIEILSDQKGRYDMTERLAVLEQVCPGIDVRKIPVLQLPALMDQITKELSTATNPT